MNEIVEESHWAISESLIWQGYKKTGSVTPVCRYPPWYSFQEEVSKDRKIEKKILRLENVAISGLPAEIFLAINVVVFVGAG